jgi:DNA-directed RNA polymerase specialized sigma24 family protein
MVSKAAIAHARKTSPSQIINKNSSAIFKVRFSRCRGLLHFIACRVLGSSKNAEDVVQSCWLTASRNPPTFEYEGAFRSWLLRILIDEALAVLYKKKEPQSVSPLGPRG